MDKLTKPAAAVAGTVLGIALLATPAAGKGGEIGDGTNRFELTNTWTGKTDLAFRYGRYGDEVYVGDWDGDGIDTPAVRRGNEYHIKNSLSGGDADHVIRYGRPDETVLVGDWDGDGRDTLAVRRGRTYHVKNSIAGGDADIVVTYGRATDEVVVGDWDGQGGDSLGVRRDSVFHVKNTIAGGDADIVMTYGAGYFPALVGDWDGDGTDTVGLRIAMPTIGTNPVTSMDEYDRRLLELINAERISRGLAPAYEWPRLRPAALRQSHRMVDLGRIQHATWDVISAEAHVAGCSPASELLVRTWQSNGRTADPRDALDWYLGSPDHRPYVLHPEYRYVSSGTVEAGNFVYNTLRWSRDCS